MVEGSSEVPHWGNPVRMGLLSHIESSTDLKGPELVSGALTRQRQPKRSGRSSKVTGEQKNSKKSAAKKNEKI
ncbi:unnamed protein product [Cyprideis torosa]|uniref:Uncharacterized protein n=1 Tax=Cyprideis torosa TaxID=163714 RepID=A0A7R8WPM4_9CRUS|nr:unnamed protein product [Cyprideis torosa]CAG0900935.1 unnamed protein product [Cyprideis torosa]